MPGQTNHFLQTLQHLRYYEEMILFADLLSFEEEEQQQAIAYLANEYAEEALNYPFQTPGFDPDAALWAARTVYLGSQLLLHREHNEADLPFLFPVYSGKIDAAAMLSADLVLRFLPDLVLQLKTIDPDDSLIPLLEGHLGTWHYSGIRYSLPALELGFDEVLSSPTLFQLYADRVIRYKNSALARHPALKEKIQASLGLYASSIWNEFNQAIIIENETH